jgi:hypothetical protein
MSAILAAQDHTRITMTTTRILLSFTAFSLIAAAACNTVTRYPTAVSRPAQNAPERFVRADSSAIFGTPGAAARLTAPEPGTRAAMFA